MNRAIRLFGAVALVAAVAVPAYLALRPMIFGIRVTPMIVTRGDIVQTVVASGRAETPQGVDVGSQIIGAVSRVFVDEGARVKAGDPLIALDDRQARAGTEQAAAALEQARVKLTQLSALTYPLAQQTLAQAVATRLDARAQLDRALTLADRFVATGASVDTLKRAFDVADAQVRAAELAVRSASPDGLERQLAAASLSEAAARLRVAEAQLRLTAIASPIDGLVTKRDVEEGIVVQAGKTLLHIAPNLPKQLVVQIDERNLGLVKPGLTALASADANPAETFAATVSYINTTIDADRGSVEVKFAVPDAPAFLKENMTVSVDIEVARRKATLLLPLEAVRAAASAKPTVMAIQNGRAVEKPVRLGARDTTVVEIVEGVAEGDRIVPAALAKVKSGDRLDVGKPAP